MAKLKDLESLPRGARTSTEWLNRFTEEERKTVVDHMRIHPASKLWPILSTLEDNPYPFSKSALQAYVFRVKAGEVN